MKLDTFKKTEAGSFEVPGTVAYVDYNSNHQFLEVFVSVEGEEDSIAIKLQPQEKVNGKFEVTDKALATLNEYTQELFAKDYYDLVDDSSVMIGKAINVYTRDGLSFYHTMGFKTFTKLTKKTSKDRVAKLVNVSEDDEKFVIEFEDEFGYFNRSPKKIIVKFDRATNTVIAKLSSAIQRAKARDEMLTIFGDTTPEVIVGADVTYGIQGAGAGFFSPVKSVAGYEEASDKYIAFKEANEDEYIEKYGKQNHLIQLVNDYMADELGKE